MRIFVEPSLPEKRVLSSEDDSPPPPLVFDPDFLNRYPEVAALDGLPEEIKAAIGAVVSANAVLPRFKAKYAGENTVPGALQPNAIPHQLDILTSALSKLRGTYGSQLSQFLTEQENLAAENAKGTLHIRTEAILHTILQRLRQFYGFHFLLHVERWKNLTKRGFKGDELRSQWLAGFQSLSSSRKDADEIKSDE
ncbi:hypothetical protein IPG41_04775 [Candidatus Peregrinibacteria bacterium]|nr:MAG: hypothetical protein IPG41_04775 [Candidatus Peregrinibacteria bacterium]